MTVDWVGPFSAPVARLTLAAGDRAGQLVDADLARRQRGGIGLDAHGIFGRAEDVDLRHAVEGGKLPRQQGLGIFVQLATAAACPTACAMNMIGTSAGFTLRKVGGCGIARGSCRVRGRDRRLHVLGGAVDVAVELELDGDAGVALACCDEVIESMPAMVENWFSSGVATADAMVSGSAPGRLALTAMVGKSTFGSSLTGRLE